MGGERGGVEERVGSQKLQKGQSTGKLFVRRKEIGKNSKEELGRQREESRRKGNQTRGSERKIKGMKRSEKRGYDGTEWGKQNESRVINEEEKEVFITILWKVGVEKKSRKR